MTQLCESCLPATSPTLRVGLAGPVQGAWPRSALPKTFPARSSGCCAHCGPWTAGFFFLILVEPERAFRELNSSSVNVPACRFPREFLEFV